MNGEARAPVALVTGGRRGIGAAICHALAKRGFAVAVADIERDANAEETLRALKNSGARTEFFRADIGDIARHSSLLDRVWKSFGTLDCLVNNAGVQVKARGDLLDVTPESFDRLMAVNLRGTFFLTQAAAKRMVAEKRAKSAPHRSIVTISSINVMRAAVNRGEYCMSKSALTMMTKLFALRLAEHGIHCYEIRPGVIATDMTAPAKDRYDTFIAGGGVPMKRWGDPTDVGEAVASLAAGALPFSTGDYFAIDGGLHIETL